MSKPYFFRKLTKNILALGLLIAAFSLQTYAQGNFQSGSTGVDGAFNPTTSQIIAVPETGIFNFTTITIPSGVTITFSPNSKNTPVTILATADVVISGTINVAGLSASTSGTGGKGGIGGFDGGTGGFGFSGLFAGVRGSGPGGGKGGISDGSTLECGAGAGHATNGTFGNLGNISNIGLSYGSALLQPLTGGSGGGGGGTTPTGTFKGGIGGGGGGGGGTILIASSTTITLTSSGVIDAKGGAGSIGTGVLPGGGGSGGAVRFVTNTISGNPTIDVRGGAGGVEAFFGHQGGTGGQGYIRAEAFNSSSFAPNSFSLVVTRGVPNPVILANTPEIKIISVAGINAPTITRGSLQSPADIIVPSNQPNPVTIALEGRNLPNNAVFTLTVSPATGASTSTAGVFSASGTVGVLTASPQITLPTGLSIISANAVVDLTLASLDPIFIDGERIDKIEITAVFGGDSQTTYITNSGKRIIR